MFFKENSFVRIVLIYTTHSYIYFFIFIKFQFIVGSNKNILFVLHFKNKIFVITETANTWKNFTGILNII